MSTTCPYCGESPYDSDNQIPNRWDSINPDAVLVLSHRMSCLSEDHWAASWDSSTEYALWTTVITLWTPGSRPPWGMDHVEPERIEELADLSVRCGGWTDGVRFIPIDEWAGIYASHMRRHYFYSTQPYLFNKSIVILDTK